MALWKILACVLLMLSTLSSAKQSFKSKLRSRRTTNVLTCLVLIEDVQYEGGDTEEFFRCIPTTEHNFGFTSFNLELPDDFVQLYGTLLSNEYISIDGGELTENGEVWYPEGTFIRYHGQSRSSQADSASSRGKAQKRHLLVVRVSTEDAAPTVKVKELVRRIFDLDTPLSLRSQYKACSGGKLDFVPGEMAGVLEVPGILEITLNGTVANLARTDLTDLATAEAQRVLGLDDLSDKFDNVIFNHPPGSVGSWAAYAFLNYFVSVYNDKWVKYISAVMHEVGHNLGLTHSNENGTYKDQTGYMGFSYGVANWPMLCFNGAKNWQMGWFDDRNLELSASDFEDQPQLVKVAAFVDYELTTTEKVGVRIGELYLQYNRAKGVNFQTREKRNQLTITEKKNDGSELLAGLNVTTGPFISDTGLVIQVCSSFTGDDDTPDYLLVSIGQNEVDCPDTLSPTESPAPSPSPSVTPTAPSGYPTESPIPSPSPSRFPTGAPPFVFVFGKAAPVYEGPLPTTAPSKLPSASPTESPSSSPTGVPSPSPTVSPSAPPTPSPSGAPSPAPSSAPSRSPTGAPSSAPTSSPSWLPSAAPSYILPDRGQVCDDNPNGFFLLDDGLTFETCYWLNGQSSAVKSLYCGDAESAASELCPETCEWCSDDCEDSPDATFQYEGESQDCSWLAQHPDVWDYVCIPGETAFEECKETCNSCVPYDADCNDSTSKSFFVNDDLGTKTCIWLADESRTEFRKELCVPSNPAFHICEETCGKCYDNCFDDGDIKFEYKGNSKRNCGWLSIRKWEWSNACAISDISQACQETCNSCSE